MHRFVPFTHLFSTVVKEAHMHDMYSENQSHLLFPMTTNLAIMWQENGVWLDVTVDDSIGMQECQSLEASLAHSGNLHLIHSAHRWSTNTYRAWKTDDDHDYNQNLQTTVPMQPATLSFLSLLLYVSRNSYYAFNNFSHPFHSKMWPSLTKWYISRILAL